MNEENEPRTVDDPHNLDRFVKAQAGVYERALSEIKRGRKTSHWMWYLFPQLAGLGFSSTTKQYSIKSAAEARAYLKHPILGPRLLECTEATLRVKGRTADDIFGATDARKLRSCATLFASVLPKGSVFHRLLNQYFQGAGDDKTLELLGQAQKPKSTSS